MKTLNHVIAQIVRSAWVGAILLLSTGCSLVFGISDECTVDADCAAKGSDLRCEQHLCVGGEQSNTDSNTQGSSDSDTNTGGNTDTGTGSPTDSETVTSEPLTGMDLLGEPCLTLHGMDDPSALVPKDAIIIGAILELTGELAVAGAYFDHVTILANEELNRVKGIQGRPILMVTCDSATTPGGAKAAAEHLRDLGVQAVLGPFSSELAISVYYDVLKDAGMILVTAGANAPIMSEVSAEGLIWSTSLPAAREAAATAQTLLHNPSWGKVAVIHRDDTWGTSMFNSFFESYCSEPGALDCADESVFMVRSYPTTDLATSLSIVLPDLIGFQPDVTVGFAYIEDSLTFFSIVAGAGAPAASIRSMLWNSSIGSDILYPLLNPLVYPVLCQIQGTTQQMPSGTVYTSFLSRYRSRWGGEDVVPYVAAFYDAAYMLAYAYAAASTGQGNLYPTGTQLGAAMQRLSSGTAIRAGTTDWQKGVTALRASGSSMIDYVGASGNVDFLAGTGSIISPVEAFRLNVGELSVEGVGLIYSNEGVYSAPDYSGVVDTVCLDKIRP